MRGRAIRSGSQPPSRNVQGDVMDWLDTLLGERSGGRRFIKEPFRQAFAKRINRRKPLGRKAIGR